MHVSEFMSREVFHIAPDASLDEAMAVMDAEDVRHLPVVEQRDGEPHVIGVLSERDLLETTGWLPARAREVLGAPSGVARDFMHHPVVTISPESSIVTAALRLVEWNIGCLPVLEGTELVGVMTDSDVLRAFVRACAASALPTGSDPQVAEVMTAGALTAAHRMKADEALELCRTKHVRHLPLLDGTTLVGIVSDRDLRLCQGRGQLEETPLVELMAGEPLTTTPDAALSSAAALLVENRIGALPVVAGEELLGLLSTADLLAHCTHAFAHLSAPAES